ncbi:MAG: hypothetical protein KDG52_10710 [Rhodocyclaceae bacterium]|nr:hypothetical protein [Rhodocyclaceae bacterium]
MPIELILPVSMVLAIFAWGLAFAWYVHPRLRVLSLEHALRPLLLLHGFRYVGLMFLIPGVTSEPLDLRFAAPAAYGDLVAALLALAAIAAFRLGRSPGIALVWLFNVWGLADLVNAVARGLRFTPDGALGATFWIPALIVPLLLVSHVYIFQRLVTEHRLRRMAVTGQGA